MEIRDNAVVRRPATPLDPSKLPFGRFFSPNMFMMDWEEGAQWHDARIVPYADIALPPAALVFHYGQEIFEGLKAFRHADGSVHMFRPDRNAARFNRSAKRMSMPELSVDAHVEAMKALVCKDIDWVPNAPGTLYIRPTMIATEEGLGVRASARYLHFIITGPTGPYFQTAGRTVRIMVARDWVRAAPGGTGEAKTGGNYAGSLVAGAMAKGYGCDQVLWLDAVERRHVEEVGAMNVMFVFDGVVTTAPTSGTILEGVTRESLRTLCKDMKIPFVERAIHIEEVFQLLASGQCTEVFGCGTAAAVSAVGELVDVEKGEARTYKVGDGNEGPVARQLREAITAIQFGHAPDKFGWLVKVC